MNTALYGEQGEIPYNEIDCEIRNLVRLINTFEGIRTVSSCAGHSDLEETRMSFICDNTVTVDALFRAMPFWGFRAGFVNNQPQTKIIWAQIWPEEQGGLTYSLHIGGTPTFVQRALIGEIESTLTTHLSSVSLQETHPFSAICGSHGKQNSPPHCR